MNVCSLADRVTVMDGISIFRGCWWRTIRLGREINEVAAIENVCRNLHLGTEESDWKWALTDTGLFSVSSLRYAIDDMHLRRCGAPTLWSKLVPLKVRIHVWMVRLDRLPTKANLLEKGLNLDTDTCPLCSDSGETGDHLFITCRTAVEVRRRINVWWNCLPSLCNSVHDFFEEISSKNQPDSQRLLKEAIGQAYVWAMWKGRNDLLFNNKAFNILGTANWIQSVVFLWCNSRNIGDSSSFEIVEVALPETVQKSSNMSPSKAVCKDQEIGTVSDCSKLKSHEDALNHVLEEYELTTPPDSDIYSNPQIDHQSLDVLLKPSNAGTLEANLSSSVMKILAAYYSTFQLPFLASSIRLISPIYTTYESESYKIMVILTGKPLLFFCLNFFIYLINYILVEAQPLYHICGNTGTYAPNSRYARNLDEAMSTLPETNSGYGFYNISVGEAAGPDTANVMLLCGGDVSPDVCQSCFNDSIVWLRQRCPNQTEALYHDNYCLLRYSNATVLGNDDMNKYVYSISNPRNSSNTIRFSWALSPLLADLRGKAADGGSLLKFATGNTSLPDQSSRIYALEQCTPDLSTQQSLQNKDVSLTANSVKNPLKMNIFKGFLTDFVCW
ncbi:hypothetical protein OSB04_002910 [Centaurea solstitialis]|uniref:Gnk2-homologous domain-containing protein n=1 Tax=Centaurea solstitialis TaxID=347529 RepID=A0AA38WV15_9ASTR|nr:hypothetical protein OSB04_002910 [Centaurea solstitialis]